MYLDIQRIKAEITMEHILGHYGIGIQLRDVGTNRLSGCCPIHHGDNPNAFHVDLKRNLFHCFTHCGGGSIFDFVMKMERMEFYAAARKIWETFYPPSSSAPAVTPANPATHPRRFNFNSNFKHGADTPFLLQHLHLTHNDNLFRRPGVPILKLQITHPYLEKRNISTALAMSFHMGYCKRGIMKDRIAIPIIDVERHIVAYAGRAVNDSQSPRYLFPKNFKKSQNLFNIQSIHCIYSTNGIKPEGNKNKPVFLVEGFFACIHIVKAGFDAIALMGTTVSPYQLSLMKDSRRPYILMMDGDEAGRKATPIIENKLNLFQIPFRTVNLSDGKQPDQLENDYLKAIENEYREK
jgi:DNA primase